MKKTILAIALMASAVLACTQQEIPAPVPSGDPYGYTRLIFVYDDGTYEESAIKPVYLPQ